MATTETYVPPRSRRALLVGLLGGLGAWVSTAISRPSPAHAGSDGDVVLGTSNSAESLTYISNSANNESVFSAISEAGGVGLTGRSASHWGIHGMSSSGVAIYGESSSKPAVLAVSWGSLRASVGRSGNFNGAGVTGICGAEYLHQVPSRPKTGVFGSSAIDASSKGVWGQTTNGVGLYGQATSGSALQTAGRAKFSTSGVATITAGSTSKVVDPGVNVTSGSFVLLTPKANICSRALWFITNATANTFTIRMSSARSSGTKVAWLLLG